MTTKEVCKVVKLILAEEFGIENVSVRKGTGTACHWVHVTIWTAGDRRAAEQKARDLVYSYKPKIDFSTYYTDDPVAEERDCVLFQTNRLYPCGHKWEARPALSRFGHGDICSQCGTREALEGDFIGVLKEGNK